MLSGVPVYSQPGRGGGWELVGGASTDLTGLTGPESRALSVALGVSGVDTDDLASAVRKIGRAVPATFRPEVERAARTIRVDSARWGRTTVDRQPEHLTAVTSGVIGARRVAVTYEGGRSGRWAGELDPLGLVAKAGNWYLVAAIDDLDSGHSPTRDGRALRTMRVDRIAEVEVLETSVVEPPGFDLDLAWAGVVEDVEELRIDVVVTAEVSDQLSEAARWTFGRNLELLDQRPGWSRVKIGSNSARLLAYELAGFGAAIRLLEAPSPVVDELTRVASELIAMYPGSRADNP